MTWLRSHPLTIAYMLICVVFASSLAGIAWEADQRRESLCETVNDQQAVLSDLLDVVLDDRVTGEGLPLTALPEFQALDIETQAYLIALEASSVRDDENDPESFDNRLRRFADSRLVPAECS